MIDLREAREHPEEVRAALARRGAADAFDALLAADERWRALVPQVDELRARQKIDGKPTPEQLEELRQIKERLRSLEEQLSAAEAEREQALAQVPNPPHASAADGLTEDDAVEIKRWGDPPQLENAQYLRGSSSRISSRCIPINGTSEVPTRYKPSSGTA